MSSAAGFNQEDFEKLKIKLNFDDVINLFDIKSKAAQKLAHESGFISKDSDLIKRENYLKKVNHWHLSQTQQTKSCKKIFSHILDVSSLLKKTQQNMLLSEIELFEIKTCLYYLIQFWKISPQVLLNREDSATINFEESGTPGEKLCTIEALLQSTFQAFDPENTKTASFYIYEAYDQNLGLVRKQKEKLYEEMAQAQKLLPLSEMAANFEEELKRLCQIEQSIETRILQNLSEKIRGVSEILLYCLAQIFKLDLALAQIEFMHQNKWCIPEVNPKIIDQETSAPKQKTKILEDFFHPLLEKEQNKLGQVVQKLNISTFDKGLCFITGSHMSGKSSTLKTLALIQLLFQTGFIVPAKLAKLPLVSEICYLNPTFSYLEGAQFGMSSFALEVNAWNTLNKRLELHAKNTATSDDHCFLVLMDEPAMHTNPREAQALLHGFIKHLSRFHISLLLATHFSLNPSQKELGIPVQFFKTQGIKQATFEHFLEPKETFNWASLIDYSLVEEKGFEVPQEALKICQLMGLHSQIIEHAQTEILGDRDVK